MKMKIIKALLLFLGLTVATSAVGQYVNPDPNANQHTIADDGYASVALNHVFPLYGETYTNSWMLANGVVMFRNPGSYGFQNWNSNDKGWCCNGRSWTDSWWNTSRLERYSFALAPFWTDLKQMDNDGGFYSLSSTSSTKYWWHKIEEYNKSNNENSFSLEIFPSGNYEMEYGNLKITNHHIAIGVAGDLTNAEFIAHEYHNTSGQNYIYTGTNMSHDGIDLICSYDPLNDASCDGYAAAYLAQQCGINALHDQQCPGYAAAYLAQQCGLDSLYDSQCPGYDDAYFDQQCGIDSLYDPMCSGYAEAYIDDQCEIDPMYSPTCSGYNTAVLLEEIAEEFDGIDDGTDDGTGTEDWFDDIEEELEMIDGFSIDEVFVEVFEEETGVIFDELPEITDFEEEFAFTEEVFFENAEEISDSGEISEIAYIETVREELEEIIEEDILEEIAEEIEILEDLDILDVLEDDIIIEEEGEKIIEVEKKEVVKEKKETAKKKLATRIVLEQTRQLVNSLESSTGESSQEGPTSEVIVAQQSGQMSSSQQNQSQFSSSGSPMTTSQDFFGADNQSFAQLTGSSVQQVEEMVETKEMEQTEQTITDNLAFGDAAPIGFTIVQPEVQTEVVTIEVPQTRAEQIAEQVRQQNLEKTNPAASGQTSALDSLASTNNLNAYYGIQLGYNKSMYNDEQVYKGVVLPDNPQTQFKMFSTDYGKMRTIIRSQY